MEKVKKYHLDEIMSDEEIEELQIVVPDLSACADSYLKNFEGTLETRISLLKEDILNLKSKLYYKEKKLDIVQKCLNKVAEALFENEHIEASKRRKNE